MTTKITFALAASAMALIAISGTAYAGTVSLKKHQELKHQRPTEISRALASASQQPTEYNTHRYHGGPKSND
jgi:hypothetical protein